MMKLGEIRRYRRKRTKALENSLMPLPKTIYAAKILEDRVQIQLHDGTKIMGHENEYLVIVSLPNHKYKIWKSFMMENYYVDQNVYVEDEA